MYDTGRSGTDKGSFVIATLSVFELTNCAESFLSFCECLERRQRMTHTLPPPTNHSIIKMISKKRMETFK